MLQVEDICSIISNFKHLQRLNLGNTRLTNHLHHILDHLTQPLHMLRLANCHLTTSDLTKLLISPLAQNLSELDLSQNDLSPCHDTIQHYIVCLCDTLTVLELEGVNLSASQMSSLFQKMLACDHLRYLNVMQNTCLTRHLIMESFVYFFVTPLLEVHFYNIKMCSNW